MTDSTDETLRAARTAFARLARENPGLTDIDHKIMHAFEQLMLGRPEITDGRTSAVNICAEAGVSRASYYRSPVSAAIKEVLGAPQAKRPEADELRQEIARLKKTAQELRIEKAAEIRELRSTVAAYANQIQILTLRNAELEADAHRLRAQLVEEKHGVVKQLRNSPTSAGSRSVQS
ncbi:hypothetical protein J7E96_25450 [Streptomyces sp. ISL-96]|uniref:hypothetical protein n=1 Tax=Streptomyces sp. ISL-96 TaxID=2819191 RepID=UPI001BEB15EF|nr:hypothetical protein [Streptomyces sp. ISL-96]MBT2491814.1 hypothetical protein [Streptomyces sp. ISL-96]